MQKRRRPTLLASALAVTLWVITATSAISAEELKLSSEKHAQIESAIAKFMSANSVPGVSAAVVENGEAIVEKMKKINPNKLPKPRPNGRPYAETRGSDPDGNYFDISEHGFLDVQPVGEKKPS